MSYDFYHFAKRLFANVSFIMFRVFQADSPVIATLPCLKQAY